MQAFAMFASDLDATSRKQLERGSRLTELLRQPQYSPYPVEEQVLSVWAGTNGHFDDIAVSDVLRFESELLTYVRSNTQILQTIAETGQWTDDTAAAATTAIEAFKKTFITGDGKPLVVGEETTTAIEDESLSNEQIIVQKRR